MLYLLPVPETSAQGISGSACRPRRRISRRARTHSSVAAACKALGDENRLAMMQMIVEAGELCACDIERHFELSQPTISHHLKLLRNAGLIVGERRGTWIYYRSTTHALSTVVDHPVFVK